MSSHERVVDRDAIAEATRQLSEPIHACLHVFADEPGPRVLCALHPASGVRCVACAIEHHEHHKPAIRCVSCGEILGEGVVPLAPTVEREFVWYTNPCTTAEMLVDRVMVHLTGASHCAECA